VAVAVAHLGNGHLGSGTRGRSLGGDSGSPPGFRVKGLGLRVYGLKIRV